VTVKGGIRYTQSDNSAYNCGVSPNGGNVNTLFNLLGSELGKVPFTPIGPNGCYTLNQNLVPGEAFRKSLDENNVSWRVGADYRAASNALLYANVSRGYKSGSFPTLAAANYRAVEPVSQESVTAYEAGFKVQLLDNRLDINGAGFYYKYNNKQVRGKVLDPIFGLLDLLINVPQSEIEGGEADVTVRPIDGLRITNSVTYLNSDVIKYNGYNILGNLENFAGARLPFTPKWSNVLDAEYRYTLPSGGTPFFGITANSRTQSDAAFGGSEISYPASPTTHVAPGVIYPDLINGYTLVDLRAGYESADGKWRVMLWGKNVFDQYYWVSVVTASDTTTRLTGRPVSYGITLSYKFM
jgi:outer membrane receptor protein involved in Fe transport